MLNDYKNSEYLRNLAHVKSIRSKNFKALVRSLKTAVSNPDYDYNQFLELLDQVQDFADVLDADEVKNRYMNKYKSINKI